MADQPQYTQQPGWGQGQPPAWSPGTPGPDTVPPSKKGVKPLWVAAIAIGALFTGCVGGVGIGSSDSAAQGRIERLEADLVAVESERDALEAAAADAPDDGRAQDLEEQLAQAEADLSEAEERIAELERQREAAIERADQAEADLAAAPEAATPAPPASDAAAPASSGLATSFGDGTFEGGIDIEPGTYVMTSDDDFCAWHDDGFNQAGFGPGQHIVDVTAGQRITTSNCGATWTLRG